MSELKTKLIEAQKENSFLKAVYTSSLGELNNSKAVANEIAMLHNEGLIDAISEFSLLSDGSYDDIEFLNIIEVFKNVLPSINAPINSLMSCIKSFNKERTIEQFEIPFTNFLNLDSRRPQEAIEIIASAQTQWQDFLIPSIVAGANFDIDHYTGLAIQLTHHEDLEIRKRAIIALGKVSYTNNLSVINLVFKCLQLSIAKETDGTVLYCLIKAIFNLFIYDNTLENKIIMEIGHLLTKGDEHINHAASELFSYNIDQLPVKLLDILIAHLKGMLISDKNILRNIDSGVFRLFQRGETDKAIHILGDLLVLNQLGNFDIEDFQCAISVCRSDDFTSNKIITKWLLTGNPVLCKSLLKIISHKKNYYPTIYFEELKKYDERYVIFVARKAVGYFFSYPVVATSIVFSLLDHFKDKVSDALTELLFNPLLINYPGGVSQCLEKLSETSSKKIKNIIQKILKEFDSYSKEANSVGEIKELQPAKDQIEADYRSRVKIWNETSKKLKNNSPIFSIIHPIHILFGSKSVSYRDSLNGQTERMEIQLQQISTEAELPRISFFDPVGLEYKLFSFRIEEIFDEADC